MEASAGHAHRLPSAAQSELYLAEKHILSLVLVRPTCLGALPACRLGDNVRLKAFEGASHMGILQDRRLIGEVAGLVTGGAAGRSRARTESSMTQRGLWGHLQQLARAKAS